MPRKMTDSQTPAVAKNPRGEAPGHAHFFQEVRSALNAVEAVMITTLPRGSLQIVLPPQVSESLLRSYTKDYHAFNRVSWSAILRRKPVRASECWSNAQEFENSR